jgi:hypothetical protein
MGRSRTSRTSFPSGPVPTYRQHDYVSVRQRGQADAGGIALSRRVRLAAKFHHAALEIALDAGFFGMRQARNSLISQCRGTG